MAKIKSLAVGLFVIGTSLLALPMADAIIITSGTNCMAANLNQALQGIGWSQAGVVNNSTSPFFVVCPVERDLSLAANNTVVVWATFPGAGTVECTARAQTLTSGNYTSVGIIVSSNEGGWGPDRGIDWGNLDFSAINAGNTTIVCALDPGEGIEVTYAMTL